MHSVKRAISTWPLLDEIKFKTNDREITHYLVCCVQALCWCNAFIIIYMYIISTVYMQQCWNGLIFLLAPFPRFVHGHQAVQLVSDRGLQQLRVVCSGQQPGGGHRRHLAAQPGLLHQTHRQARQQYPLNMMMLLTWN